jgi:hypothetical protein
MLKKNYHFYYKNKKLKEIKNYKFYILQKILFKYQKNLKFIIKLKIKLSG